MALVTRLTIVINFGRENHLEGEALIGFPYLLGADQMKKAWDTVHIGFSVRRGATYGQAGELDGWLHGVKQAATSWLKASARWLMACLALGSNSPKVMS
mgnify:CR=1 FL=1